MSDYIDETSLTDEEVAAAIAEARAKKAQRAKKERADGARRPDKAGSLDDKSSDELVSESSSAAALEEAEDESPAVRSARSFSDAFAAAKKKREQELLKKKDERPSEPEEDEEEDAADEEEAPDTAPAAAVTALDDSDDDAEFDEDDEEEYDEDDEEEEYDEDEEDDEEYDEEDDEEEYDEEEYDEEDEDDDEEYDGIFETDDENGEYTTHVSVDEDSGDEEDDDEDEDGEEDDDSAFSTKTKVIIGIVIAVLVLAIVAAIIFFMRGAKGPKNTPDEPAPVSDSTVTSVKFTESSLSLKVGERFAINRILVAEPAGAEGKTFKIKSNDDTIAKITEDGFVEGVSSGSTTVTATLKSNPTLTASIVINVIDEEQSTLNIYNKFVNSIIDGTTDIEPHSDSETIEDEQNLDGEEADTESDSDTDSEQRPSKPTHTLTGNKIEDLNGDGDLELALYYAPASEDEERILRIFHLASEAEEEEPETDSETAEIQYDEYGNVIDIITDSEAADTDKKAADSDKKSEESGEKKLVEIAEGTELYQTCASALENDSATNDWNTSYIEVKEGDQTVPRVKILSSGYTTPTYTFESENQEIATIDDQGNIKGVKPGTVIITVSSPLNSEASAKIKVRVKDDTDLLDDYLAEIPQSRSTNDSIFPTETLIGKAITDIDGDGISDLLLRFSLSDNVEVINIVKVENEKCVCYKTYNNLSDLYEYNDGNGSYANSILVHYTTGRVCMESKAVVEREGSKSRTSEQKIMQLESGGSLSDLVTFRTSTEIATKTVTSEVVVESTPSTRYEEDDTDSATYYDNDDTDSEEYDDTTSHVDEDGDGWDDITNVYFGGAYAEITGDEIDENGIDMSVKKPVKKLPQAAGAPGDDEDEDYDYDYDDGDDDSQPEDDEPTTSTVTTEVTEETTKYFVNGTAVDQSVYEETLTRYSATYSVWNAWESV